MKELLVNNEIAYQLKRNQNYYLTKSGILYSIYIKGAHGRIDINNPHKVKYGQDKDGYYRCVLSNNGIHDRVTIHRLVAEQFIGAIPDGYVVNHIDGNKHNNNCTNLEIVTALENINHAWATGLSSKDKNPNRIKIDVYDNYEHKLYQLSSIEEAKTTTNFKWRYINKLRNGGNPNFNECEFKKIVTGRKRTEYYIECYYNGTLFKTFKNNTEAGNYFGKSANTVSSAYKSQYGKKLNRYTLTFPNVSTIENIAS